MIKNDVKQLPVFYHDRLVGILAQNKLGLVSFAYDKKWLSDGFSLSPFSLPLTPDVFTPKNKSFGGLFGVFADSLPDTWGSKITTRYLEQKGYDPLNFNILAHLQLLTPKSLGALRYGGTEIDSAFSEDLDALQGDIEALIAEEEARPLDDLMAEGGTSGGANPKAHLSIEGKDYIVKFPTQTSGESLIEMEYDYNRVAASLGIEVAPFRLLVSKKGKHCFASERFDRRNGEDVHMISLAGLYEVPPSVGVLDYGHLLLAAFKLSHEEEEVWKAYRLLCFNVASHNCDDHSKNFAFLYDESKGHYVLSPAFDLTLTPFPKQHSLTVHGEFFPTEKDVLALASEFRLNPRKAKETYETIEQGVKKELGPRLAKIKQIDAK
jgi:serine/threonine-protein kinase HipA